MHHAVAWLLIAAVPGLGRCAEAADASAEIEAAVRAYVEAFNARDAEALVRLWSPDGVYISRSTGETLVGRDALLEEFTEILGDDSAPRLEATSDSVDFVSPNVAIERGTAVVTPPDDAASVTSYQAVYVRRDGEWLVDRVTETELDAVASNYERLAPLEWLVGDWISDSCGVAIEITIGWTKNQNFLTRAYKVVADGAVDSSGLQVIGWDAERESIVSWLFDSDGGVVTAVWTDRDDRWVVQAVGESWPILETGLYNLTENEASALLHFEDGTTQQWTMARLDEPTDE